MGHGNVCTFSYVLCVQLPVLPPSFKAGLVVMICILYSVKYSWKVKNKKCTNVCRYEEKMKLEGGRN